MDGGTDQIKFLGFDVFGTIVDWRTGVAKAVQVFLENNGGVPVDPYAFADDWRALYQPSMARIREGHRAWVPLTILNRENLETVLKRHNISSSSLPDAELETLNEAWERLDPWPDVIEGLLRLKRVFGLAPFSNGSIANMVKLARYAALPWDAILGAEISRTYKPQPETYLRSVEALGLRPSQVAMVAAHNDDLFAARQCGLRTIFIHRPTEYGQGQTSDLTCTQKWDFIASDLNDLASQMGC